MADDDVRDVADEPEADEQPEAGDEPFSSPSDWDDWRQCLAWLCELFYVRELAKLFDWPEASLGHWYAGRTRPEPPRRREIIMVARIIRGRLMGIEARGYAWEAQEPLAMPAPEEPLEEDERAPDTDELGFPTGERRDQINQRLRELAEARGDAT